MTEIGFYHLTRTTIDRALPLLLARALGAGERACVLCASPARRAVIDAALWADVAWLPHNGAEDEDPDLQPIWLGLGDEPAPNSARFLFLIDGAASDRLANYRRVFDLFDGQDEHAVAAARRRWAAAREAGHALTYWRQSERGWEKVS